MILYVSQEIRHAITHHAAGTHIAIHVQGTGGRKFRGGMKLQIDKTPATRHAQHQIPTIYFPKRGFVVSIQYIHGNIRWFAIRQVLLKLYYKVIIPSVTYGITVWGGMSRQDDFDALERLHCRGERIIFNLPKDMPSTEVLDRGKWDTLRNTYKLSILKLIYKIYHNDSPSCMARLVTKFQHSYNFRKKTFINSPII